MIVKSDGQESIKLCFDDGEPVAVMHIDTWKDLAGLPTSWCASRLAAQQLRTSGVEMFITEERPRERER